MRNLILSRRIALGLLVAAVAVCAPAPKAPALDTTLENNKKIALAFYDAAINQKDYAAAAAFLGPQYIQHNPGAAANGMV